MNDEPRLHQLKDWLAKETGMARPRLRPVAGDASFRRYFRLCRGDESFIVMDAPPDKEDCRPFVAIARTMEARGLNVPRVLAADLAQGFLLLTDLGDVQYAQVLTAQRVDALYDDALVALLRLQAGGFPAGPALPDYGRELLWAEMALFKDWLLERHCGIHLGADDERLWRDGCERLAEAALTQPRVWVHRDYHSRNLMYTQRANPGILDFQDAVRGPITYDLVSLLRDCYIAWPEQQVLQWQEDYRQRLLASGLLDREVDTETFAHWCDWMAMQRHLKAAGIFARLYHRDGKAAYLADIPRTVGYIVRASRRYGELEFLHRLATQVLERLP